MADSIDSLQIEITSSAGKAAGNISKLAGALDSLKGALSSTKSDFQSLASGLSQVGKAASDIKTSDVNKLAKLSENLSKVKDAVNGISGDFTNKVVRLVESMKSLSDVGIPKKIGDNLNSIIQSISNIDNGAIERIKKLSDSLNSLRGLSLAGIGKALKASSVSKLGDQKKALDSGMEAAGGEEAAEGINKLKDSLEGTKTSISTTTKRVGRLASAMDSVSKAINKTAISAIKRFGKALGSTLVFPFTRIIGHAKSMQKSISGFVKSITRIMMYRAVRSAIKNLAAAMKEGVENLYQYSTVAGTQFRHSLDMIATSALYMKNSLATIAEPLINAVAPIIDLIADKFAQLSEIVARFVSSLTGSATYSIALKYPKNWAEAANKAAKAAERWLGPFDEINRLNASNGGGVADSLDYGKMFETIEINDDSFASKLVKEIKEAFESGDFSGIGSTLSSKITDALDRINWTNIREKADKIGRAVGTFITGFLGDVEFANSIGISIAQALNTGVTYFSSLVGSIDFDSIGTAFGSGVRTLLENFDWEKFVGTVAGLGDGFLTFFINSLKEINKVNPKTGLTGWETFGKKIGDSIAGIDWEETLGKVLSIGENVVTGIFTSVSAFLETDALTNLASSFGSALGTLFTDVEWWKKVFNAAGDIASAFIEALFAAIGGVTGKDLNVNVSGEFGKLIIGLLLGKKAFGFVSKLFGGGAAATAGAKAAAGAGAAAAGGGTAGAAAGAAAGGLLAKIGSGISEIVKFFSRNGGVGLEAIPTVLAEDFPEFNEQLIKGSEAVQDAVFGSGFTKKWSDFWENFDPFGFGNGAKDLSSSPAGASGIKHGGGGRGFGGKKLEEAETSYGKPYKIPKGVGQEIVGRRKEIKETAGNIADLNSEIATLKKNNSGSNPLGEENFTVAANTINAGAIGIKSTLAELVKNGLKLPKEVLVNRDALGEIEFGNATRSMTQNTDMVTAAIPGMVNALREPKKVTTSKNLLGEDEFSNSAQKINNSVAGTISALDTAAKSNAPKNFNFVIASALSQAEQSGISTAEALNGIVSENIGLFFDNNHRRALDFKAGFSFNISEGARVAGENMTSHMEEMDKNAATSLSNIVKNAKAAQEEIDKLGTADKIKNTQLSGASVTFKPTRIIQAYASGGFVQSGEIYIARESGPELVGRMGSRNAVANNAQIVAGIAEGVEDANEGVVNAVYAIGAQIVAAIRQSGGASDIDWNVIARRVTQAQSRQAASSYI